MSTSDRDDGAPWRNFYGRRHGKTLRAGQRELLDTRLAELEPPGLSWDENPERTKLDLAALFPGRRDLWLEIGFGGGEHLVARAAQHPDVQFIGCEPFVNGAAMLLSAIEGAGLANLSITTEDARNLMDVLPDGSVGRVFLLYPDPWPKRRHWKRRFVGAENLDQLARVMRAGADLCLATDIPDYVRHSLEQVHRHPRFACIGTSPADWREPWAGWPSTRYEKKAIREGRRPHYLTFRRI